MMISRLLFGYLLVLHVPALRAHYHVLVAHDSVQSIKFDDIPLQSHIRERRSLTNPNNIIMSMMSEEGSGTDPMASEVQNFEFILMNNDTANATQTVISELMPANSILMDFLIHNNGKTYTFDESSSSRTLEQASKIYEDSAKNGKSVVMLGDVQSAADRCSDCGTESMNDQSISASINMAPRSVLSISLSYMIPDEQRTEEKLYRNDVTIHLGESADKVTGVLMSPNYPYNYPNDADLTWLVQAPRIDMVLLATLASLETEACCDHIYIYDGNSDSATELYVASGDSYVPENITTSQPNMFVKFQSDSEINDGGFALRFSSLTKNTIIVDENGVDEEKNPRNSTILLSSTDGIIQTPNYPEWYPADSILEWKIIATENSTIDIRIIDFDVSIGEILEVIDLTSGKSVESFEYTDLTPINFNVPSNEISIQFNSQGKILPKRGLYAKYSSRVTQDIVLQNDDLGWNTLFSPNYPENYANDDYCAWQISSDDSSAMIHIEIVSLDLEKGYDFVLIYEGDETTDNNRLVSLSGRDGADVEYLSSSQTITIIFVSDRSITGDGFQINYRQHKYFDYCSTTTQDINQAPSGTIRNPSYPSSDYLYNNCYWLITAEEGNVISISLERFYAYYYGQLTFYDGPSSSSSVLWRSNSGGSYYSSDGIYVTSSSNQVFVTISRSSSYSSTFSFDFHEISADLVETCPSSQVLSVAPGQIKSPHYPNYSPTNINCNWLVQAPDGYKVTFIISDYYSYSSSNHFRFYDGSSTSDTLLLNCGSCSSTSPKTTSSSSLLIVANIRYNFFFKLTYEFGDQTLMYVNQITGVVSSPSYPDEYDDYSYQIVHVNVSSGNILFKFGMFITELHHDYLYMYDGLSTSSHKIAALSGNQTGFQSMTTGRYLTLEFRSDSTVTEPGYLLYYCSSDEDCSFLDSKDTAYAVQNSNEFDENQYLSSPSFFGHYPNNVDFYWYIECPSESFNRNYYSFSKVDIDDSDHLNLYSDYNVDDSTLIATFSGTSTNYRSTYNKYVYTELSMLWFHSDIRFTGLGFYLSYVCQQ